VISFGPSEEQEVVRETLRGFAEEAVRPLARECDEESHVPDDFLQSVWELGLTSTQIPESHGGGGEERSPVTNALVLEELAYGDAALALAATAPSQFAFAILDQGSEEQKQAYLPLFCGDRFHAASLALIEPIPAFDVFSPRTVAEPKGDAWVLSGTKSFVPFGDRASHFLVLARAGSNGSAGVEAFVVPRDAEGLSISEPEKKMGLKALPTHGLTLERVEVAAADRLGGDAGCDVARLVNPGRVGLCAVMTGLSRAVMEYAIPYAKDRHAFDQAIAQKQAVAFMLSDMAIETDSMRWMLWRAASQLEQGLDATRSAHLARAYAAKQSMKIADNGIQVLGGHGFIREHPVEMWYRHARCLGVLEGVAAI
jgi:alkylation response protein AidB-like acyl-CoA dehydrogenase